MEKNIRRSTRRTNENIESSKVKDIIKLIAVIRIAGDVKIKKEIKETFYRLRLRRKYVLVNSANKNLLGMTNQLKNHIAYGEIDKETLIELIKNRGVYINKTNQNTRNNEKIAEELYAGKKLEDFGLKPFFRMHPPRGGINSKMHYPKGIIGNNKKDINKLIKRML